MRRLTGIMLMALAFGACETIIDVETPSDEHKIVAHSFFTPDSVWAVNVTLSLHTSGLPVTLSSGDPNQTVVVVSDDRGGADTLQYTIGRIGSNYRSARGMRPRPGVTYTLRVETPGYISSETLSSPVPVEATARLPERVSVQNVVYSNDNGTSSLRFSIADPPGANYYRLEIFQMDSDIDNTLISYDRLVDFRSVDPSLRHSYEEVESIAQNEELNFDFYGYAFLSDALFDGTMHTINITLNPDISDAVKPRFIILLSTLSHEFFMHQKTLEQHLSLEAEDNTYYAPEVYPIPVYTNIRNGFGVFAGYVTDAYRFDADGNEW